MSEPSFKDLPSSAKEYQSLLDEELGADRTSIEEKYEELAVKSHEWLRRLYDHKTLVDALEDRMDEMKEEVRARIETSDDVRLQGLNKSQIQYRIETWPEIKKIQKLIKAQKRMVFYLEEVLGIWKFQQGKTCEGIRKMIEMEGMG